MAIRTGTQLRSDLGTCETALDTAISSPTVSNRDALVTALNTAIANARDSRGITSSDASGRKIHQDLLECADALRHTIINDSQHHQSASQPVGPASIYRQAKRTHLGEHSPWRAYRSYTATTD